MTVGEKIKILRIKQGLTQKQLAQNTGLSEITIRKYESDDRHPKIETIRKIAKSLDSNLAYFLEDNFGDYIEEIKEDFSQNKKKIPPSMQIEVNDKYGEELKKAKQILKDNPRNPQARAMAKKIIQKVTKDLGYQNERDFLVDTISLNLNVLNERGLSKVQEFTNDLILIKDYLEDEAPDKIKCQELNAAHKRTDTETNDEMEKHDDDIMNDDSEWE